MANFAVFEDVPQFQTAIRDVLADHQIVAEASTVRGAFDVLGQMATHELDVDIVLLDGQLASDAVAPTFRRSDYLPPLPMPTKRRFHRAPPSPKDEFSPSDYRGAYADAWVIVEVMKACGIEVPVIGISTARLREEAHLPIVADVQKGYLSVLPSVVDDILNHRSVQPAVYREGRYFPT